MIKVIVTELEYTKAKKVFESCRYLKCMPAPADEESLAKAIQTHGARHVIIGVDKYSDSLYESVPSGGVIARFGVGHDGVDKDKASEHGILCTNTPGALDESVAESAIGLMLTISRKLNENIASVKQGNWCPKVGRELRGKTIAIIGCGAIGQKTAAIAVNGFGMKAVGCDPFATSAELFSEIYKDFKPAVEKADFVSLHIPDIPATKDFINAERLSQMPSASVLINTARGGVVDENALFDALSSQKIAGAALDVFKCEPYSPQNAEKDLRTLDNVVMTPHTGSSTREACERMAISCLHSIELAEQARYDEMPLLNKTVSTTA